MLVCETEQGHDLLRQISFDTGIGDHGLVVQDMTVEAFGKRSKDDPQRLTTYEEGPWLYKRNSLYYLIFAAGPISEHIGYSTGPSPNAKEARSLHLHCASRNCSQAACFQGEPAPSRTKQQT